MCEQHDIHYFRLVASIKYASRQICYSMKQGITHD